jgi:nucleoid-associated protein YgaU
MSGRGGLAARARRTSEEQRMATQDRSREKQGRPDFGNVQSGGSSTAPPARGASPPRTYTVKAGDSLSKIAQHFYGDANQWRKIYEANREDIHDPDLIHPGQTFTIPEA